MPDEPRVGTYCAMSDGLDDCVETGGGVLIPTPPVVDGVCTGTAGALVEPEKPGVSAKTSTGVERAVEALAEGDAARSAPKRKLPGAGQSSTGGGMWTGA